MQEIILQKIMFGHPLKLILGCFVFLALNQNIHTMDYFGLFNFSFKFISCKCYL